MNCPSCQSIVQVDDGFCNNCGHRLSPGSYAATTGMGLNHPELAKPLTRLGALLIDIGLTLGCYLFYGLAIVLTLVFSSTNLFLIGNLLTWAALLALVVYQLYLLSLTGQTLGKRWLNIKVIRLDTGQNGGFVTNVLVRIFLNSLLGVGICYIIVDPLFIFRGDRRCIHDLIADTQVVKC